jgi:hypothetical protein
MSLVRVLSQLNRLPLGPFRAENMPKPPSGRSLEADSARASSWPERGVRNDPS